MKPFQLAIFTVLVSICFEQQRTRTDGVSHRPLWQWNIMPHCLL